MDIYREEVQSGAVQVTILKLVGELDASNFKLVIAAAQRAYTAGTRNLLLDMSELSFMTSSGLVALHNLALLMRGEKPPSMDEGWDVAHAIADYVEDATSKEKHFKLLNPQVRVMKTLERAGFDYTFEVYSDRETAIASFD